MGAHPNMVALWDIHSLIGVEGLGRGDWARDYTLNDHGFYSFFIVLHRR